MAELFLQGWSQTAIAEHLGFAQATVSNDIKRVREAWRESSVRDFDELRSIEILKIERVEREAWAGWERSQQPQQIATIKGEGGPGQKASKTMKSRIGDPRFLDIVARCSAQRRELLGLDLPAAGSPALPVDQASPMSLEDQRGQLLAMIASMKERAQQAEAEAMRIKAARDEVVDVQLAPMEALGPSPLAPSVDEPPPALPC